jgi:hypothetical protein
VTRGTARDAYAGEWLALVTTLPVDDIPARMRALRAIESLGAGIPREGVYLLPESAAHRKAFAELAQDIQRAGGAAHVLVARPLDTAEAVELAALFDRSPRYAELIKTVESLRAGYGVAEPAAIAGVLAKQRRDLAAIIELDFFDSSLRKEAERVLGRAEAMVKKLLGTAPDAPHASSEPEARTEFFQRVWATRTPVSADRVAAAWLIRRFVDPEAKFALIGQTEKAPQNALGFGYAGATFAKSDGRGAFDALLVHFELTANAGLAKLAQLIRALEGGGEKPPEAASVESLLKTVHRRARSEADVLAESEKTFDMLYEAYFPKPRP